VPPANAPSVEDVSRALEAASRISEELHVFLFASLDHRVERVVPNRDLAHHITMGLSRRT